MKHYLPILFICLPLLLHAQRDSLSPRWKITTKPTEILFGNIPITVERVFARRTLGITASYRPAYQNGGEVAAISTGMFGDYQYQYAANKIVEGLYVSVNSKQYVSKRIRNFYIDPELFYRRWWCDDKMAIFKNVEGYRFDAIRTESVNVYGLKVLAGYSFVLGRRKKPAIVVDAYGGLGVRYKSWVWDSKDGTVLNTYYVDRTDEGHLILPSVQLGVQFGLGL